MPLPLEISELHQDAVLWPATGIDNVGSIKLGAAVEIRVRAITDIAKGTAGEAIVDREIPTGSHFWLGALAGFDGTQRILQVSEYLEVPDIKGRNLFRRVKLVWLKDVLAKIVGQASLRMGAFTLSGGTEVAPSHGIGNLYMGAMTLAAED